MLATCPKTSTGGRITSRGAIMGRCYRDADHLYEIYGYFLDRLLRDEKIGPKMASAGVVIKFI